MAITSDGITNTCLIWEFQGFEISKRQQTFEEFCSSQRNNNMLQGKNIKHDPNDPNKELKAKFYFIANHSQALHNVDETKKTMRSERCIFGINQFVR